jgi:hypothetical protein
VSGDLGVEHAAARRQEQSHRKRLAAAIDLPRADGEEAALDDEGEMEAATHPGQPEGQQRLEGRAALAAPERGPFSRRTACFR